jgi:hypothetical protein
MSEEKVSLPGDYTVKDGCDHCIFKGVIQGDRDCGDQDSLFCDFGQDYSFEKDGERYFNTDKYIRWVRNKEVDPCGCCSNFKLDPDYQHPDNLEYYQ